MTKAILIEDEPESLRNLKTLLEKHCPDVEIIAEGGSNADLLAIAEKYDGKFDVAFLDISLPDGLVFQGLEQLDDIPFDIVFVTAYNEYALNAFDFSAIDYILKPLEPSDLQRAVSRVTISKKNNKTSQRLEILQQNIAPTANAFEKIGLASLEGTHFVFLKDIVRLEGEDNYTHFYMANGDKVTASKTIKVYEEVLLRLNFVRTHKRHIVNMNFIKTYVRDDGGYLVLENNEKVDVARRKKTTMLEKMRQLYGEL